MPIPPLGFRTAPMAMVPSWQERQSLVGPNGCGSGPALSVGLAYTVYTWGSRSLFQSGDSGVALWGVWQKMQTRFSVKARTCPVPDTDRLCRVPRMSEDP